MDGDAWVIAVPTVCEVCGREACEEHLPPAMDDPPPDDASRHDVRVGLAVEVERVRREARRLVDAEERPPEVIPALVTLRDRLARRTPPPAWRIQQWQARESRVMAVAQFKAGKTTLRDNVVRSLVDGDPFLGREKVEPLTGALALVDTEMAEWQMEQWLGAQAIQHDDQVLVLPLRGHAAAFNILDDRVRREWAARLRERQTEYLVLDCLRPVLDALGLDEQREAGRFLVAFDALLAEAGIPDALVIQHMGHLNERARGDSRLRDWPDAEWRLVRRDDDPASARFITAYGRDVDVPESQLVFNPMSRHLTIEDGSRRDAKTRDALDAVLEVLGAGDALSGRKVKEALEDTEHSRETIDAALRLGVRRGVVLRQEGPRNAKLYRSAVVAVSASVRQCTDPFSDTGV
jgi:hypothetical protein